MTVKKRKNKQILAIIAAVCYHKKKTGGYYEDFGKCLFVGRKLQI